MVYLVVKDPDDIGVYEFVSRGVAEKTAKIFKQAAVLESYEKEKAMSIVNASEVIDATFLIRKYKNSNISTAKTDKEKAKNTPAPTEIKSNFVTLINKMKDIKNNSVRIEMINGDEFYLALKSLFYITKPEYISKMLYVENGEVILNTNLIDDLINKGIIGIVPKSKIEMIDNFAVITNCDDKYSPNTKYDENKNIRYEREYEKIVINTNQIESISPADDMTFGDYDLNKEIIVKYLVKKML